MKTAAGILVVLLMLTACKQKTDIEKYNDLVKKELASNKKVDSIFFGIYLGMPGKDFYTHCWEMNKKEILMDGKGNNYVLYKLKNELKYPASLNFYPDFNNNVIWRMRANVEYEGWSPWTKYLGADSLMQDVLKMCRTWYSEGNPFIRLRDEKQRINYIKVDGNRKITIRKADDVIVRIDFTDLNAEKSIKNIHEN
jgi:hypothetical protein